jgi:hypothetical protein
MSSEPGVDRIERASRNQTLFREVNERLEGMAEAFQEVTNTATFACECADLACVEQIQMSRDEYEAVRTDPNQFAVLPGHVYPDVENVIDENGRFAVVAKIGVGARIAAEADPRS